MAEELAAKLAAVDARIGPLMTTLTGVVMRVRKLGVPLVTCQSCNVRVGVPLSVRAMELVVDRRMNTSAFAAKAAADRLKLAVSLACTDTTVPAAASGSSPASAAWIVATLSTTVRLAKRPFGTPVAASVAAVAMVSAAVPTSDTEQGLAMAAKTSAPAVAWAAVSWMRGFPFNKVMLPRWPF